MRRLRFKRILLKISGEALAGDKKQGFDKEVLERIAEDIIDVCDLGVQVAVVIGGGNLFRGNVAHEIGLDRVTGDYMGMLATIINALALQDICEKLGMITRVQTAIEIKSIAEPYIRRKAIRHLEKERLVILGGGTGNPYFSTDTTAALRAIELGCEVLLKATRVDGVYDKDPIENKDAILYSHLTFMDSLKKRLKVMDATALSLCMDNHIPIIVFNIFKEQNLKKIVLNQRFVGTYISN